MTFPLSTQQGAKSLKRFFVCLSVTSSQTDSYYVSKPVRDQVKA